MEQKLIHRVIYQDAVKFMHRLEATDKMRNYQRKKRLNYDIVLTFAKYEHDLAHVNLFADMTKDSEILIGIVLGGYKGDKLFSYEEKNADWCANTYESRYITVKYVLNIRNGMPIMPPLPLT